MDWITIIGFFVAVCTTIAWLPQVIKSIKTKETKDLFLGLCIISVIGVFLWLVYGISKKDFPLIFANSITLALTVTLFVMKLKYK